MSGILSSVKAAVFGSERATAERLEASAADAARKAEALAVKVAEAVGALVSGEVAPGPGAAALARARAEHAAALADAESLSAAAKSATAARDEAERKAAEEAEAKRQAALLAEAETLDAEARKKYREFLAAAEKLVAVATRLSGWRGSRFDVAVIMQEEAQRAAAGVANVATVTPWLFAIRLPDTPEVARVLADAEKERARRHTEALRVPVPTTKQPRLGEPHRYGEQEDREERPT